MTENIHDPPKESGFLSNSFDEKCCFLLWENVLGEKIGD